MSSNEVPDLANVLKTLSAFNPSAGPSDHGTANSSSSSHRPTTTATAVPNPHIQSPSPAPARGSVGPDPSTITTWPAALRSVMNTVSQNDAVRAKIRHLISTQHDHEKTWWKARVNLLDKQKSRAERKQKLDEVLRSVGGSVAKDIDVPTPDEEKQELKTYDEKVYRALTQMSKALDSELRALRIPFFAIRYELVLPAGVEADAKGHLSTEELHSFKGRVLELLQDLCKE